MHQRPRQRHLDPLALRETFDASVDETFHSESSCKLGGAPVQLPAPHAVQRSEIIDVFARGQIVVETRRMRQNTQMRARSRRLPSDIESINAGGSAGGPQYAVQHAQAGRFAGPVGSQQSGDFAVARNERDLADGIDGTESFGQRSGFDHGGGPVELTKNGAGRWPPRQVTSKISGLASSRNCAISFGTQPVAS